MNKYDTVRAVDSMAEWRTGGIADQQIGAPGTCNCSPPLILSSTPMELCRLCKLGIRLWIMLRDEIDYNEFCRRGQTQQKSR
jgi:hypothetical protein